MPSKEKKLIFGKKLSTLTFIISQILLLVVGLSIILFANYLLNIQYQAVKSYSLGNGPVTSAPTTLTLEVSSPSDDSLGFQSAVVVSGNTSPNLPVLISATSQNVVVQSSFDGSFSTVINLDEGVNYIKIVTFSATGDQRSVDKTIYYSKEKL